MGLLERAFTYVALLMWVAACGGGGGSKATSVHVPNVVGEMQAGATTTIANAGLRLGGVNVASDS